MSRRVILPLLLVSLAAGLAFPVLFFLGRMEAAAFKTGFLIASAVYFLFAILWAGAGKRRS